MSEISDRTKAEYDQLEAMSKEYARRKHDEEIQRRRDFHEAAKMGDKYTTFNQHDLGNQGFAAFLNQFKDQRQLSNICASPKLLERVHIEPAKTPKSTIVEYLYGVTIVTDPFMPENEIQLRNKDGFIIGRIVIDIE